MRAVLRQLHAQNAFQSLAQLAGAWRGTRPLSVDRRAVSVCDWSETAKVRFRLPACTQSMQTPACALKCSSSSTRVTRSLGLAVHLAVLTCRCARARSSSARSQRRLDILSLAQRKHVFREEHANDLVPHEHLDPEAPLLPRVDVHDLAVGDVGARAEGLGARGAVETLEQLEIRLCVQRSTGAVTRVRITATCLATDAREWTECANEAQR